MCVNWKTFESVKEYAEKLAEETSHKLLVIQWDNSPLFSICLPNRHEIANRHDVSIHHRTVKGIY